MRTQSLTLQPEDAKPVDEETRLSIEAARNEAREGQIFTPAESRNFAREEYQDWRNRF